MEKQLKSYIVKHIDEECINGILGCFDSKEKAKAFLNRFKNPVKDYEIVAISLNPKYIANKLADPYMVSFKGKRKIPLELEIYDSIEDAELAKKEDYTISFYSKKDTYHGIFDYMVFASSKKEALAKAIKKRDEVIASGEWEKAYQESKK